MVTNILDYMYEGYGYDMDNQLLYTDVEKYNEALDKDGYADKGMKTFSSNDWKITGYQEGLPTEDANKYKGLSLVRMVQTILTLDSRFVSVVVRVHTSGHMIVMNNT